VVASTVSYTRSYSAVAESVPAARAEVTEFAERAGAQGERLEAVRLAVSEAVTNVVIHAYADRGPGEHKIQVCASAVEDGLWILVTDEGDGLRRRAGKPGGLGLGLALIAQLADDMQLVSRGCGGTELRMRFCLDSGGPAEAAQSRGSRAAALAPA
jgi:serine/threonine-protein kinase RsbW